MNKPCRLTPEEFEIMKTHTTEGARLLGRIPQLQENGAYYYACDIARHHHERWDGRGYPDEAYAMLPEITRAYERIVGAIGAIGR